MDAKQLERVLYAAETTPVLTFPKTHTAMRRVDVAAREGAIAKLTFIEAVNVFRETLSCCFDMAELVAVWDKLAKYVEIDERA